MAEATITTYMRAISADASTLSILSIQWVSADNPAPRITPLEAQLVYYSRLFDSATTGALLARLPPSLPPGKA